MKNGEQLNNFFGREIPYSNSVVCLLLGAIIAIIGLSYSFADSSFLLGGDGDYHLHYSQLVRYGFSWADDGLGTPVYAICTVFPTIIALSLIEKVVSNITVVKFILYFGILYLTFVVAYLVSREFKISNLTSFLLALFYMLNPFFIVYFTRLNMSLTVVPCTLMFNFYIISRFYRDNFRLFFYFGVTSALFAFANTNPPLLIIIQIALILSLHIVSYYKENHYNFMEICRKGLIISSSFFLFNFWWIVNLLVFYVSGAGEKMYTKAIADEFLNMVVTNSGIIMFRLLTLTSQVPVNTSINYFARYYNTELSKFWLLIPIVIVAIFLIKNRKRSKENRLVRVIFFVCLAVLFFAKGTSKPLGQLYIFLFKNLPLFYIFKGPIEKFGVLYIFLFTLLLIFIFKLLEKRNGFKYWFALLSLYVFCCAIPVLNGNLVPDSLMPNLAGYMEGINYESVVYKDKEGYQDIRNHIDKDETEYRILGLPGSRDYYAVTFKMYENKYYSGIDTMLANSEKSFITFNKETERIYSSMSSEDFKRLLGIYNIKRVILNEDLIPRYSFPEQVMPKEIREILMNQLVLEGKWGNISVFRNPEHIPCVFALKGNSWHGSSEISE